ncbi:MAG: Uridylate kinase [Candidatus Peregrinibacteria bacterium GW2011_GWA2_44_7]|nr:MAG: Uridylate kinase [Candidatus Peregrinibacteria bacterium GW2011_GWA2_44_7]
MKYSRIMLKFSGEVLQGKEGDPIDFSVLDRLAGEIAALHQQGVQIAVVIGGGNIWRYRDNSAESLPRVQSDFMGMMATVMNGVALHASLERAKIPARVFSALGGMDVVEPYVRAKVLHHLEKGRVVICVGGTGHPYFTTDSAAALRGLELQCNILLKATKVDGVYDRDPVKDSSAQRYETIRFQEVLEKRLAFMDSTASSLCWEGGLEVLVFDLMKPGNLSAAVQGLPVGTRVHV